MSLTNSLGQEVLPVHHRQPAVEAELRQWLAFVLTATIAGSLSALAFLAGNATVFIWPVLAAPSVGLLAGILLTMLTLPAAAAMAVVWMFFKAVADEPTVAIIESPAALGPALSQAA